MTIKVGSRKSKLALKQVEIAMKYFDINDYEVVGIETKGDKKSAAGLSLFDKLNFVEDIENKLISNEIDIAIHSAKDMPAKLNPDLGNTYIIEGDIGLQRRAQGWGYDHTYGGTDAFGWGLWGKDILIFRNDIDPVFKAEMKLGTSSLRRKMQAKFFLGAKNIHNINGNIDTRIKKLNDGTYDCIILAHAGCERLGLKLNSIVLDKHMTLPSQGKICVQTSKDFMINSKVLSFKSLQRVTDILRNRDSGVDPYFNSINMANRFLRKIGADCHSAVAIHAHGKNIADKYPFFEAEIYGKDKYIEIGPGEGKDEKWAVDAAIDQFYSWGGEKLLNEHN